MNVYDEIAHLYATDDEPEAVELPTKTVTVAELNADHGDEPEELDARDLDELALLVKANPSDRNMVELGLARWDELDAGEIILNAAGREVLGRIVDDEFPGLREAGS